jgi:urate oxidase / 2-oxo-4-hydroxy-4-carboxy-5-ureidoimidazoline decarboxylase
MKHEIHYGKADVKVYRTHGAPLHGVTRIPESPFGGRDNILIGAEIEVTVGGDAFWDAYTVGDNRQVVATDTMKNFIQRASLGCAAPTLEGWLHEIGEAFLATYPQMESIDVSGRELPFSPALVSGDEPGSFAASEVLFSRERCDASYASLDLERGGAGASDEVRIADLESGRSALQLVKITGSSFADFARDEHTTLPERPDRPLYIWCDVGWRYADPHDALGHDPARYVAGEQVADLAASVFHEFVSLSIQHLVHEIGQRMLARWPHLSEVSFEAQNRLWDLAAESTEDQRVRVYADPRPPFGRIGLTLRRE